ncbi:hypothetical protein [Streptomyces sp. NPDC059479]|uniref:hypothetical protein n=1 Tax=Streptomyces sp. NPDC059479 TaxID=3346848 RepID=UPI00368D131D
MALGQSYITGYGTHDATNQHSRWYAKSFDKTLPNPPAGTVAAGTGSPPVRLPRAQSGPRTPQS